jgi:pyrimidine-nucleoside phosphorylase
MSKKLAAGAQAIVLDVKVGEGAFMKTLDDARGLAEAMLALGQHAGRDVVCLLTDMDQPLGTAVGNALEVSEARRTISAEWAQSDLSELVLEASARLLVLSDLGIEDAEARKRVRGVISDGSAAATWTRWIEAQGGTADETAMPSAPVRRAITAPRTCVVTRLSAIGIANAALHLGAGRRTKADAIDHAVGVLCIAKRGHAVEEGEMLAVIHARDDASADTAVREVVAAYELGDEPVPERPVLLEVVS